MPSPTQLRLLTRGGILITINDIITFTPLSPIVATRALHRLDYLQIGIALEGIFNSIHPLIVLEVDALWRSRLEKSDHLQHRIIAAVQRMIEVSEVKLPHIMHGHLTDRIGNADDGRIGLYQIGNDIRRGGPFAGDVDGISPGNVRTLEGLGV